MRIVTLVGNRPQFIKAAAVSRRLRQGHDELLVHSGQHYDDEMSAVFFEELDLPAPDAELEIGSGPDGVQIGKIISAFEPIVVDEDPDLVLVYGDTNTTVAGALTAARLDLPLAHVEAGMRSFDRSMPEERNRILADHLSSLCLCSTEVAVANLRAEQAAATVEMVGDVMADLSLVAAPIAEQRSTVIEQLGLEGEYVLVTVHRAGNVDDPRRLELLVEILTGVPDHLVFPMHPRTRARLTDAGLLDRLAADSRIVVTPPLGYLDFTKLLANARAVLTDSGGVQKESYLLETPCVTLRPTTEWVETVESGWNVLTDLDRAAVARALDAPTPAAHPAFYGAGEAVDGLVDALHRWELAAAPRP